MGWYRFFKDKVKGQLKIDKAQVAWYDMTNNGRCFDEDFCSPDEIDKVITYVETIEDMGNRDRSKVFVHFDNGDIYELNMEKVNFL